MRESAHFGAEFARPLKISPGDSRWQRVDLVLLVTRGVSEDNVHRN